jgi:hypothetical protein
MNSIFLWATNPVWPMIMGAVLYIWITIGFFYKGWPWFGTMWLCYAFANLALAMHSYKSLAGT